MYKNGKSVWVTFYRHIKSSLVLHNCKPHLAFFLEQIWSDSVWDVSAEQEKASKDYQLTQCQNKTEVYQIYM